MFFRKITCRNVSNKFVANNFVCDILSFRFMLKFPVVSDSRLKIVFSLQI